MYTWYTEKFKNAVCELIFYTVVLNLYVDRDIFRKLQKASRYQVVQKSVLMY